MQSFRLTRCSVVHPVLPILVAAGFALDAAAAQAATIHVTTTAPEVNADGKCSLSEAIQAANGNTAVDSCEAGSGLSDTIMIPAGTYEILVPANAGLGLPAITTTVVLQGDGSAQTTIKRVANAPNFRLLSVSTASTIKGLTLSGGKTNNGEAGSTMLSELATALTLEDVVIQASRGGAAWYPAVGKITNSRFVDDEGALESYFGNSSQLTITASIFEDNVASARGALILNGPVTIKSSVFRGNGMLGGDGGAIWSSGTLTISESLFENNQASGSGGAVLSGGTLDLSSSTFVNNSASYAGGAVSFTGGKLVNSTFSGNHVTSYGAAIDVRGSTTVTINNITVAGNTSEQRGGGLNKSGGAALLLSNSVIAGNTAVNGPDCNVDNSGAVTSAGYNFIGLGTDCGFTAVTGDKVGVGSALEPKLSPLGDHGGKTPTYAPLSGSPLVDHGYPGNGSGKACEAKDQVGTARPVGAACDIGAFEGELDGGGGAGGEGGSSTGVDGGAASGGEATGSGDAGSEGIPGTAGNGGTSKGGSSSGGNGGKSGGGSMGVGTGADKSAGGESNGDAGTGSPDGEGSGSESSSGGCGCRVAGRSGARGAALALLVAGAAFAAWRRRAAR